MTYAYGEKDNAEFDASLVCHDCELYTVPVSLTVLSWSENGGVIHYLLGVTYNGVEYTAEADH